MSRESRGSKICSKGGSESRDRKGGMDRRSRDRRGKTGRSGRRYKVHLKRTKGRGRSGRSRDRSRR
jgi:hypothetical protein